jgi:hypothetical protein
MHKSPRIFLGWMAWNMLHLTAPFFGAHCRVGVAS